MKRMLEVLRVVPEEEMDGVTANDNEVLLILGFSEIRMAIGSEFLLMVGDLELMKLELLQVFFFGREIFEIPIGLRVVSKFRLNGSKSSFVDSLSWDEDGVLSQKKNINGVFVLPIKIV